MAKKRHQNPPKAKEFHSTPFGALKGIAVAEAESIRLPQTPTKRTDINCDDSLDLFFRAVADVQPLKPTTRKMLRTDIQPLQQKTRKAAEERIIVEESVFLEEIAKLKLDSKFADSIPDEGELQPLSGNRLRQVKNGVVSVNHQLDLHGLTREEALEALAIFLRSAQKRGQKAVLVITGKGNHSTEEPVLHQAVASWLRDAGRSIILEYAPAPREMGGSGAYVIFLRQLPVS